MFDSIKVFTLATFISFTLTAHADIEVTFLEGAPKDRFVFKNTGKCSYQDLILNIDLSRSQGKLIFDTTSTGAGVEVFQPFEVTQGDITLSDSQKVNDGDSQLSIVIKNLGLGQTASFTIDVDDTMPVSELGMIRVSDAEIKNGQVSITSNKHNFKTATFGNEAKATALQMDCSTS